MRALKALEAATKGASSASALRMALDEAAPMRGQVAALDEAIEAARQRLDALAVAPAPAAAAPGAAAISLAEPLGARRRRAAKISTNKEAAVAALDRSSIHRSR